MNTVNTAAYKFIDLESLEDLRQKFRAQCLDLGLKGSVLLSMEGINLMLAGSRQTIKVFKTWLQLDTRFADIAFKDSLSHQPPFNRLMVKIKKEIVTFGVPGIRPHEITGKRLSPKTLKKWLDNQCEILLLDTRNDYEVNIGTFRTAQHLNIAGFRDFPAAARKLEPSKDKAVVMFCTGGVRCEKASVLLLQKGFREVYQLDGGILNYFEVCGGDHWEGDCFVFDQRVSLTPDLKPTYADLCLSYQAPPDSNTCPTCDIDHRR